ncbi:hypothetical protein BC833DRAFT_622681 [Globomyces pollinis-pini]|nr:hypothetical protein BC833DRAFT_622681 [Globomyces pollinis-pini]
MYDSTHFKTLVVQDFDDTYDSISSYKIDYFKMKVSKEMKTYFDNLPIDILEEILEYLTWEDMANLKRSCPILVKPLKNLLLVRRKLLDFKKRNARNKGTKIYYTGCYSKKRYSGGYNIKYDSSFYEACIAKDWKRLMEWKDVTETVPYPVRQDGIFQKLRSVDEFQNRQNLVLLALQNRWVDPNKYYRRGLGEFGCCFSSTRNLSNMPLDTAVFNQYKKVVFAILNHPDFEFDQVKYQRVIAACFYFGWRDVVELLITKFSIAVPENSFFKVMGSRIEVFPSEMLKRWTDELALFN